MLKLLANFSRLSTKIFHVNRYISTQKVMYANAENQNLKEYFYHLDNNGQVEYMSYLKKKILFYLNLKLFMDDTKQKDLTSSYKETNFLQFFFSNLRVNKVDRLSKQFPLVSNGNSERNYLHYDELPFVVTLFDETYDIIQLNQINSSNWSFKFDPENLYYDPKDGNFYYLFENKEIYKQDDECSNDPKRLRHLDNLPCRVALVKTDIAEKLRKKVKKEGNVYKIEHKSKFFNLNTDPSTKTSQLINKFKNFQK